ncbi:Glycine rich protein [Clostridioides difficile]
MQTEWNFNYIGAGQSLTLKPGRYKIECWGACGGRYHGSGVTNTKGGYTSGEITLSESVVLYIYIGQSGFEKVSSSSDFSWTGFNGGGKGNFKTEGSNKWIYAGGGATDIRLIGGDWDNEQGLLSRIIVAGGGGGYHSTYFYKWGVGGGFIGEDGIGGIEGFLSSGGGSQYQGGTSYFGGIYNGSFGKGGGDFEYGVGGGGGWFGGAGNQSLGIGGGGSGYVLTKDSYKPKGYIPSSKYYFDNAESIVGGNSETLDGRAKITLLQALPILTISSYNSTQATFKADHTDPTLLTKIEYFIDDVLKETITTDLTTEKTINYTLEDNALHTLKIVVTDSNNATAEKALSISKNIMPLPEDVNLNDISSKLIEVNAGFKTGKTSIINTLALKNIEASLNNTLVELSEKIKTSFDSSDASVQDLINQLTQANNTINQLNSKYKVAKGTAYSRENTSLTACLYDPSTSHGDTEVKPGYWFDFSGIEFTPDLFFAECDYQPFSSTIHKNFVFVVRNIPSISNSTGFVVNVTVSKVYGDTMFRNSVNLFTLGKRNVYMNNNGVRVPAYKTESSYTAYNWYSIKFT